MKIKVNGLYDSVHINNRQCVCIAVPVHDFIMHMYMYTTCECIIVGYTKC